MRPLDLEWNTKLEQDLRFAEIQLSPWEITAFAWICGVLGVGASATLALLLSFAGINPLTTILAGLAISTILTYMIPEYPRIVAGKLRRKSFGFAPELIAYLIIPLKQNPNLENAASFAAEHAQGKMAENLRQMLWDVWAGKYYSIGEALPILGYQWSEHMPGIEDALYAIRTSQIEKTESRRLDALDRALGNVLDSMARLFAEFTEYLRIPTVLLFAGGALLPLVIIILLPLLSFLGLGVSDPAGISAVMAGILILIAAFSEHILGKRPLAFPPPKIPKNYPGLYEEGMTHIFGKTISIWKVSLSLCIMLCILSVPYLLGAKNQFTQTTDTIPIVLGISFGIWSYAYLNVKPRQQIRKDIIKTELNAIDSAFQLGNRMMSGMAAEEAFLKVSELIGEKEDKNLTEIFKKTVKNIKYRNMDIEEALFHRSHGALNGIDSSTVNTIFKMFSMSMKKSIISGSEALVVCANHIGQIKKTEQALKEKLSYTTSMIKTTAVIINPLICGVSVYLSGVFRKTLENTSTIMKETDLVFDMPPLISAPQTNPPMLQLISGVYMIGALFVLLRYVSILEQGDDKIAYLLEIKNGIPVAVGTFMLTIIGGRVF